MFGGLEGNEERGCGGVGSYSGYRFETRRTSLIINM